REGGRRRTVAERLLGSYLLVLVAFAVTVGWSFQALRAAARDAELLRAGYAPLLLRIGEALSKQDVLNTQLNHITDARNSSDVRDWIAVERLARPITFSRLRDAAERGLGGYDDPSVRQIRNDTLHDADAVEALLEDPEGFAKLNQ